MSEDPRDKWDRIYRERGDEVPLPAQVLVEFAHLLPARGRALEIACGLGGNALFLAERGLETEAWDLSAVAVQRLQARAAGLPLVGAVRDVTAQPPPADRYDVIAVSHFLERGLAPALVRALRPGGLLYYQTFTREAVSAGGPSNPAFRLTPNELLDLFGELRLVAYREEGRLGDLSQGFRDEAWLVGLKT